jgi:hypothetical protein
MASQAQIDANRRNAEKSTGPRTEAGKAVSRMNGLKHGLDARLIVIDGEDAEDFNALRDGLFRDLAPSSPTELILAQRLAVSAWRMRRAVHMEAILFDEEEREDSPVAQVFHSDYQRTRTIDNAGRYEARNERSFYRALQHFERLRAARPNCKNEGPNPISGQPDPGC